MGHDNRYQIKRTTHETKKLADDYVEKICPHRIACIEVPWTEGEGL